MEGWISRAGISRTNGPRVEPLLRRSSSVRDAQSEPSEVSVAKLTGVRLGSPPLGARGALGAMREARSLHVVYPQPPTLGMLLAPLGHDADVRAAQLAPSAPALPLAPPSVALLPAQPLAASTPEPGTASPLGAPGGAHESDGLAAAQLAVQPSSPSFSPSCTREPSLGGLPSCGARLAASAIANGAAPPRTAGAPPSRGACAARPQPHASPVQRPGTSPPVPLASVGRVELHDGVRAAEPVRALAQRLVYGALEGGVREGAFSAQLLEGGRFGQGSRGARALSLIHI